MSIHPNTNSIKTFNDPIYGFITIDDPLIFWLIEHPHFQRLRRITQLGLTNLVYSGANHSRFQHALGAMNLMRNAIATLRSKGISISDHEERAAKAAILLHDIGHGPFSHALENTIVKGVHHEDIGLRIMRDLNEELNGELDLAIDIYTGKYPVPFLHQLVSSQLDTDRLDYLKRDSFFTGVSEGVIGSERIIKMLTVHNGNLAVESKGIYSLEKFLIARRLMYWQVYLHKTVVSAEFTLMNVLLRAKELLSQGVELECSPDLKYFLKASGNFDLSESDWLQRFLRLDDYDILFNMKRWTQCSDRVLSDLCLKLIDRDLLKVRQLSKPLTSDELAVIQQTAAERLGWTMDEIKYVVFQKSLSTTAYSQVNSRIEISHKDGTSTDLSEAAGVFRFASLEANETKHFLYFPDDLELQE